LKYTFVENIDAFKRIDNNSYTIYGFFYDQNIHITNFKLRCEYHFGLLLSLMLTE